MRNQDHPGVSVVRGGKPSYPYHLSFKHPLLKSKQVKRSSKSTDGAQAAKIAIELSNILRNPNVWRNLPSETSETVRAIWNGDVIDETLLSSLNAARPKGFYGDFYKPDWVKSKDFDQLAEDVKEILEENKRLYETNAMLEAKVDNLTALLKKMGFEAMKDYAPKRLSQACDDFLADDKAKCGTNAGARKKETWRSWFNRFANAQKPGTLVHEITGQHVIEHLADFKAGKLKDQKKKPTDDTVKAVSKSLCAMLEHQTNGAFRKVPVKDWVKKHLNNDNGEERKAPYWLDQKDVDSLLKQLPEFWRDVARVQWEGGFRPEELAYLRKEGISLNGEIRIDVSPLKVGDKLIWKPKTRQSYGKVHLREDARQTIERLIARATYLLFPNDAAVHRGTKSAWQEGEEIEQRLGLWRIKSWDEQYVEALRAAAEKAGLNKDRVDGRTLRRSCGKRVLIESNYNLELAAAVLRDLPSTVRTHYARLLPEDVRQPVANRLS